MKLLRLRLKNINCFQKEVELDFEKEPLNEALLFAITGPTGSGKTTLLDALCVALYNKTPRLDGRGNKNTYNLLNQSSDEGFSEVLFEANGKRYLAEWSVKKTRSGKLNQSAKLINADSEELISARLTSRKGSPSVEESVTDILNLDFGAFNRSIMLAQGEFAAFLKATPEKKREILEATTGMDIYERLKIALNKKTNEVETEYNQAKTVLENSAEVSEEDVNETEVEIHRLEKKLDQLNKNKEEVTGLERKETERAKTHKQLVKAQKSKDELLRRQDKMDKLESEIKTARKASDIRSQKDAYEQEKTNLNKAQTNVTQIEDTLENSKKEHEKAQASFIKASESYENMRKANEQKMEAISAAEKQEVEAKGHLEQAEKRADEIEKLKDEVSQLRQSIRKEDNELEKIEDKIQEDEAFIEEHPLPENSEKLRTDASVIVNRLETLESNTEDKKADLEDKAKKQKKLQTQSHKLEKNSDELKIQIQKAQKAVEDTKDALNSLLKEGTEEDWEDQKQTAQSLQDCAADYERAVSDLKENRSLKENTQKNLRESIEEYDKISSEFESIEKDAEIGEEKVKRYEAEREYALIANEVAVLRKEHLKEGEPCPVCGSVEHPWSDKEEADAEELIAVARDNLSNARSELEKLKEQLGKLDKKRSSLDTKKAEFEKNLKQYEKKIEKLKSSRTEAENQWSQSYPDKEVSSDYLKKQISEAENYLQKINSAKNDHQKAENDKQLLAQKLESNKNEIENNKQQLSEKNEEIETLEHEIEAANQKIEQIESKFWEMMPSEFESKTPEIALDKFEKRISEVKKRNERLESERIKRERLKTSVANKRERLTNEKSRVEELKSQEGEYRQKAEQLIASAKEKTDGLSAEEARKKLKEELKSNEAKKDEMQEKLQNKRDELNQAKTNLSNAKEHLDEIIDRFDKTRKQYFDALEDREFDSPEEHQNSIREIDWIEKNEAVVEDYRKSLHSVEEQIAELKSAFEDEPYEPDKLKQIQKKLKSIEKTIEDKVDERGKLREKKDKLKKELARRRELEKGLEDAEEEYDRWMNLKECIPANALRDFALDQIFDLLARFANSKLDELTGRYTLKVKDMKDMVVIDKWNAGEERPVETLSGGESFLTSLSLALALSELSKGRTQLNSLFLDEGFGTLDSDTLDIALDTLEALQLTGRTIGVISHVKELTRRIPTCISVRKLGDGSSDLSLNKS